MTTVRSTQLTCSTLGLLLMIGGCENPTSPTPGDGSSIEEPTSDSRSPTAANQTPPKREKDPLDLQLEKAVEALTNLCAKLPMTDVMAGSLKQVSGGFSQQPLQCHVIFEAKLPIKSMWVKYALHDEDGVKFDTEGFEVSDLNIGDKTKIVLSLDWNVASLKPLQP